MDAMDAIAKKPNSSFASTRLTYHYNGPSLHPMAGGRDRSMKPRMSSIKEQEEENIHEKTTPSQQRKRSPSIDAPPESSDDEEHAAASDHEPQHVEEEKSAVTAAKRKRDQLERDEDGTNTTTKGGKEEKSGEDGQAQQRRVRVRLLLPEADAAPDDASDKDDELDADNGIPNKKSPIRAKKFQISPTPSRIARGRLRNSKFTRSRSTKTEIEKVGGSRSPPQEKNEMFPKRQAKDDDDGGDDNDDVIPDFMRNKRPKTTNKYGSQHRYQKPVNIHTSKKKATQKNSQPTPPHEKPEPVFETFDDILAKIDSKAPIGFKMSPNSEKLDLRHRNSKTSPKFQMPPDINIKTDRALRSVISAAAAPSSFRTPAPLNSDRPLTQKCSSISSSCPQPTASDNFSCSAASIPNSVSQFTFDEPENTVSSLSSPLSSPRSPDLTQEEKVALDAPLPSVSQCPMCKQPVPTELLTSWQKSKRTGVRQQRQFCRSHRHQDALETWKVRGYPEIDWTKFNDRVKTQFPRLEMIIRNEQSSFYRNALESSAKSGRDRTLQKTVMGGEDGASERLSAGYYGPKGSQRMANAIITRFSSLLRRLSTSDPLLAAGGGGVAGFVQFVLVPEVTVRFVMEDMGTDEDGARSILQESEGVGMEINEEEDAEEEDVERILREEALRKKRMAKKERGLS